MSFGDGAEWYLASLARNNGDVANSWRDNAKEWEAYAQKLEAENKRLKGDVMKWQSSAVGNGALRDPLIFDAIQRKFATFYV